MNSNNVDELNAYLEIVNTDLDRFVQNESRILEMYESFRKDAYLRVEMRALSARAASITDKQKDLRLVIMAKIDRLR